MTVQNPQTPVDHSLIQSTFAVLAFLFADVVACISLPEAPIRIPLITFFNIIIIVVANFLLWRAFSASERRMRYIFYVNIVMLTISLVIADVGISDFFTNDREAALRWIMASNLIILCMVSYLYNSVNNREHSATLSQQRTTLTQEKEVSDQQVTAKQAALDSQRIGFEDDIKTLNSTITHLQNQIKAKQGDLDDLKVKYDAEVNKPAIVSALKPDEQKLLADSQKEIEALRGEIDVLRGMEKSYVNSRDGLKFCDFNMKQLLYILFLDNHVSESSVLEFMFGFIEKYVLDLKTEEYHLSLARLMPDGKFKVPAYRNISPDSHRVFEHDFRGIYPPHGLAGHCAYLKKPIICEDIDQQCPGWVETNPQSIGSIICIPILSDRAGTQECLAVLSISCVKKKMLTQDHLDRINDMTSEILKQVMFLLMLSEATHTRMEAYKDLVKLIREDHSFSEDELKAFEQRGHLN